MFWQIAHTARHPVPTRKSRSARRGLSGKHHQRICGEMAVAFPPLSRLSVCSFQSVLILFDPSNHLPSDPSTRLFSVCSLGTKTSSTSTRIHQLPVLQLLFYSYDPCLLPSFGYITSGWLSVLIPIARGPEK